MDKVFFLLATVLGAGKSPIMPGTVGTLAGIPLCALFMLLSPQVQLPLLIALILFSIMICDRVAEKLGEKDPSCIVLDEVAGYAVTVMLFPLTWKVLLWAFVLFRFFDILKPWPVSFFDRKTGGGAGIVLDDIAAGLYAHLVLAGLSFFPVLVS